MRVNGTHGRVWACTVAVPRTPVIGTIGGDTKTSIAPTGDSSAEHVPSRKQIQAARMAPDAPFANLGSRCSTAADENHGADDPTAVRFGVARHFVSTHGRPTCGHREPGNGTPANRSHPPSTEAPGCSAPAAAVHEAAAKVEPYPRGQRRSGVSRGLSASSTPRRPRAARAEAPPPLLISGCLPVREHFAEPPGVDVIDEPPDWNLLRDPWV